MTKGGNVTVMVSDATVEAPGLSIGLHPASKHGHNPGNSENLSIGLRVGNLDKIAFFTDQDKNPLYLCETREN